MKSLLALFLHSTPTDFPNPFNTCAFGSIPSNAPGSTSFDLRRPLPIMTSSFSATALSIRIVHSGGSPTGVIAPYSMPVNATACAIGANDALRASSVLRARPFTSARVLPRTTQAAYHVRSPRFASSTTQFAAESRPTSYRAQNAAVSDSAGSISATPTFPASSFRIASATLGESRSRRSVTAAMSNVPSFID